MAEADQHDTDRSEDPTQKRLDDALARGDVVKSQEVSTWFVIAGLHDSYRLFRPGEVPAVGDMSALVTNTVAGAFKIGIQLSAPFLVFGLVFNVALGVLSRLMPQMQVYFVAVPLSIMIGFLILLIVVGAMMAGFLSYVGGVLRELAPYSS